MPMVKKYSTEIKDGKIIPATEIRKDNMCNIHNTVSLSVLKLRKFFNYGLGVGGFRGAIHNGQLIETSAGKNLSPMEYAIIPGVKYIFDYKGTLLTFCVPNVETLRDNAEKLGGKGDLIPQETIIGVTDYINPKTVKRLMDAGVNPNDVMNEILPFETYKGGNKAIIAGKTFGKYLSADIPDNRIAPAYLAMLMKDNAKDIDGAFHSWMISFLKKAAPEMKYYQDKFERIAELVLANKYNRDAFWRVIGHHGTPDILSVEQIVPMSKRLW